MRGERSQDLSSLPCGSGFSWTAHGLMIPAPDPHAPCPSSGWLDELWDKLLQVPATGLEHQ
eukprot:5688666-Prymnesium_polylepis.1